MQWHSELLVRAPASYALLDVSGKQYNFPGRTYSRQERVSFELHLNSQERNHGGDTVFAVVVVIVSRKLPVTRG